MTIPVLDFPLMDDETVLAGEATEVRTQFVAPAAQLAWSQAETAEIVEYRSRRYWLPVVLVVVAAVAVGWLGSVLLHEHPTSVAAPTVQVPTVLPSPPDTIIPTPPETPDSRFLTLMGQSGWNMNQADPGMLIAAAHQLCWRAKNQTEVGMLKDLRAGNPDITDQNAYALMHNANTVYCPNIHFYRSATNP